MAGETPSSATEPSRKAVAFGIVVVVILIGTPSAFLVDATRSTAPSRRSALAGVDWSCMGDKRRPDYRGEPLKGKKFDAQNLGCGRFRGAYLEDVTFDGSLITLGDFREARLVRVVFRDTKLTFSNFEDTVLRDVQFIGSNLWSATFAGAEAESVSTTDTTCPDGDESGGSCKGHGVDDPDY